jgi:hypothetical protein
MVNPATHAMAITVILFVNIFMVTIIITATWVIVQIQNDAPTINIVR